MVLTGHMQAANVDLLPTGRTVGYQSVTEPFAVTGSGKLGGISDVVPAPSRGRQQRVHFMGRVPDVYKRMIFRGFHACHAECPVQ